MGSTLAALIALGAAPASAASWEVRVECPELGAEARAELEVRHLVELRGLPGEPATLEIRCAPTSVEGAWQRGDTIVSRRSVSRAAGDDLLELGHWLASMLVGAAQQQGVPLRAVPETPAPAAEPERAATAAPHAERPRPAAPRITLRAPWTLGLAMSSHIFATELPGSAGPSLVGSLSLMDRFGLHAALGYEWGFGRVSGFGAQEALAAVHFDAAVAPWLSVLVGPSLSVVRVVRHDNGAEAPRFSTTAGVEALARASFPWSGLGAFVEVGVRGLAASREIRRDAAEVLTIPSWQTVVVLGAQLGGQSEK